MAEDYVFEDRVGDAHEQGDGLVHFAAVLVDGDVLARALVLGLEDLLELLEFLLLFLVKQLEGAHSKHHLAFDRAEHQLDGSLGLGQV